MRITPGYLAKMDAIEKQQKRRQREEELRKSNDIYESEYCPICGSEMKLREGNYGTFWGCTRYPKCLGTRKI